MGSTTEIGNNSSHQLCVDEEDDEDDSSAAATTITAIAATRASEARQQQQLQSGQGRLPGFVSDFLSPENCDPSDLDPCLNGIRSFRELLSFGVRESESREEEIGGRKGAGQENCKDKEGFGSDGECRNNKGAERLEVEGGKAKCGKEEQKAEQRDCFQARPGAVCEGSTVSDAGMSSGSTSLDQRNNISLHLNAKSESTSGLDFEGVIPSSIAKSDQKEDYSTQRETGLPIWVKWRGKWQACIQCPINDCTAATIKAMPTYSKKNYIVAYFPASRMYSWIDTQHVCAISENPDPLAGDSHEDARESVKDVDMARRAMLRNLAATMCDISDRLPIKAVIESAQDAGVWKLFAKEAVQSRDYSDIGKLLVRLFGMIVRKYVKSSWVNNSFNRWRTECENAESASSIEKLNEELINAILWEEVASLWDKPEQSILGSEWKDWKGPVSEVFAHSGSVVKGTSIRTITGSGFSDSNLHSAQSGIVMKRRKEPPMQQTWIGQNGSDGTKFELSRKRSKLEIRRRVSYPISDSEPTSAGHDQPLLIDRSTSKCAPVTSLPAEQSQVEVVCSPYISQEGVGNHISSSDVVDVSSNIHPEGFPLTPMPHNLPENIKLQPPVAPTSRRLSTNGRICVAFAVHKNRQCIRFANEGSVYCCKHLHLAAIDASEKPDKAKDPVCQPTEQKTSFISPGTSSARTSYECRDICRALTKEGRRCAFKAKKDSFHCKRHSIENEAMCNENDYSTTSDGKKCITQAIDVCPENVTPGALSLPISSGPGNSSTSIERNLSNWRRCVGWCKKNGEQCSHRAKVGKLHCKKHLWLANISGMSKPQEVQRQQHPSNAAEEKSMRSKYILDNYMKIALSDKGNGNETWLKSKKEATSKVLNEASRDTVLANILLRYVIEQKKDLELAFGFQSSDGLRESPAISDRKGAQEHEDALPITTDELKPTKESDVTNLDKDMLDLEFENCNKHADRIRCNICVEEFVELIALGSHWKTSHHKEAQCFLKGYICRACNLELASRPAFERHLKAQHESLPETPAMPICMVCDESFSDFDSLWEHVVSVHSDHLSGASSVSLSTFPETSGDPNSVKHSCTETVKHSCTEDKLTSHLANGQDLLTKASSISLPPEPSSSTANNNSLKYKCKHCGQRFRLLPDLGRHHQAKHMNSDPTSIKTKKRKHQDPGTSHVETSGTICLDLLDSALGARRWKKRGRIAKDGSISISRIKAAVQSLKQQRSTKNKKGVTERVVSSDNGQGTLRDGAFSWGGTLAIPNYEEILSLANSVCCATQLCNVLGNKYENLQQEVPDRILQICRRGMSAINWVQEGFVCPNGCKIQVKVTDWLGTSVAASCSASHDNSSQVKSQSGIEKLSSDAFQPISASESTIHITCEDVSLGKEPVPIPCVIDEDVMKACSCLSCKDVKTWHGDTSNPWETFTYITRRLLEPSLGLDTKNSQLGCACTESKCLPESCDHVRLFDSDNTDADDIYGQPMHGRFPYNPSGQIILHEGFLVYECNSSCQCQDECTNRVLQKGVQVKLEVFKTCHKGWAVRAAQLIPRGTFVCEYLGEVLDDAEANERGERYDTIGRSYLYDIDVHLDTRVSRRSSKPFVIDATRFGNVSRFINHSCAPNLVNYQVLVESMDCQLAHIGLFASRDIASGEELAYDYRYKLLPGKGCPCYCGAVGCRGRLY